MAYTHQQVGQTGTLEFRLFFKKGDDLVSPFHDIPFWVDKEKGIANMVVEIPRGQQAKLEISRDQPFNPIKQDVKNGKLRVVALKYPFNYGAFPQTWENPTSKHPDTDAFGDNDPLDVCNISSLEYQVGEVAQVKVLGTYAMIDEGETDWKIIVVDVRDPLAAQLNDLADIEKVLPGTLKTTFEFLRDYKIPDGKPANTFAYNNEPKDRAFALHICEETHADWVSLITKKIANGEGKVNIAVANSQLDKTFSPYVVDQSAARELAKL
jgi:inorganic pyrophosphatase